MISLGIDSYPHDEVYQLEELPMKKFVSIVFKFALNLLLKRVPYLTYMFKILIITGSVILQGYIIVYFRYVAG